MNQSSFNIGDKVKIKNNLGLGICTIIDLTPDYATVSVDTTGNTVIVAYYNLQKSVRQTANFFNSSDSRQDQDESLRFNVGDKVKIKNNLGLGICTIIDLTPEYATVSVDTTGNTVIVAYYNLQKSVRQSANFFNTSASRQKQASTPIAQSPMSAAQPPMSAAQPPMSAAQPPMSAAQPPMSAAQPILNETLNGIQHYFLWCSHGVKVSSDQFYKMECLPSIRKINFFIESGYVLTPTHYDSEWSSKYYEIILNIHRIMKNFRQPLILSCSLDDESQRSVVELPSIAFYGRQNDDPPFIYDSMGLYHYEKQPDGKFARGTKIQDVTITGSESLFYSDIFKYVKDYITARNLEGNMGLGFFCCREVHPWYPHSTTRHLTGSYVEPAKYVPLEESDPKYWFLMRTSDITPEFRGIFESGNPSIWRALLQTTRKGCGINVLSILGFLNQHQGREIVACLPATGTTMFKICDYISQTYPGHKFGIARISLNIENMNAMSDRLLTVSDTKYFTVVKLYQSLEHNGQASEVGHTVILVISGKEKILYDPQNSRTNKIEDFISKGYVAMDIILCNSNFGDSSRKIVDFEIPLKTRPSKWLTGGQISEKATQKDVLKFKELYDFLDANPIEGNNISPIEENNKNGGKYKKYKKYKRTKKQLHKKYKRTKKKLHKKSRKINKKKYIYN
jgi:hypothetical protein